MRRLGLAITAFALLAGTSAYAQEVTSVTGSGINLLNNDGFETADGEGPAERFGAQANYSAFHNTVGDPIVFEAGNSLARYQASNTTIVGVDIGISNPGASSFDFQSTITAAGMGFYVGNTGVVDGNGVGCVLTGTCVQSTLSFNDAADQYSDFTGFTFQTANGDITNVVALAQFNFDVIGYSASDRLDANGNPIGTVLYNRSAYTLLRLDELSNVLTVGVVDTGVNGGVTDLNGFTPLDNSANAFTFSWNEQDFSFNVGGSINRLQYRSTVETRVDSACANLNFDLPNPGEACIIAFGAFGDPIGRGGGGDAFLTAGEFSLLSLGLEGEPTFGLEEDNLISGINGDRAEFNRPVFVNGDLVFQSVAVPEPATWAMMIMGFGALGTVMRRRRAYVRA